MSEKRSSSGESPDPSVSHGNKRSGVLLAICLVVASLSYAAITFGVFTGGLLYFPQGMLFLAVVYLIAAGAGWLVQSASRIARHLGVSELVIGLTVVAFGTSAPELAASLDAGFKGNGDITIANVVGSNIFNLCFILGSVALLVRGGLKVDRPLVTRDGPILLGGTLLLFLFVGGLSLETAPPTNVAAWFSPLNLRLERGEGLVLLAILILYLYFLIRMSRFQRRVDPIDPSAGQVGKVKMGRDLLVFLVGLVFMVGGCHFLVGHAGEVDGVVRGYGAIWFARMWDVPDYVVGVTVVAAGTSAPEFVVSVVAASRRAYALSIGNLLGSDIFNVFAVIGLSGIVLQEPLADPVTVSSAVIPSLAAFSVVVLVVILFMWTGRRISRFEGFLLVLIGAGRWIVDFAGQGRL